MTVYIVQLTRRRNGAGDWVPARDISDAYRFGEVVELLTPTAVPDGPECENIITELREKLAQYDPEEDHVLAMGNPVLIGWAIAIAADYGGGCVSVLNWDNIRHEYVPCPGQIWGLDDQELAR